MGDLWTRLESQSGRPVVRNGGMPVPAILESLEAGATPLQLATSSGLEPADVIAALGYAALDGDESGGPPLVQSRPRRPKLADALSETAWEDFLPGSARGPRLALVAGLLQVHDFWDASHNAAQQADDLGEQHVSAFWHGIAHRREPDPGNARYWFRRVGRHPLFLTLARDSRPFLDAHGDPSLSARLTHGETWNPLAFIDLCAAGPPSAVKDLALTLQRLELKALLDATAAAVGPQI